VQQAVAPDVTVGIHKIREEESSGGWTGRSRVPAHMELTVLLGMLAPGGDTSQPSGLGLYSLSHLSPPCALCYVELQQTTPAILQQSTDLMLAGMLRSGVSSARLSGLVAEEESSDGWTGRSRVPAHMELTMLLENS
jgi:hypothetical protein